MHKAAGGFGAINVYARPRIPVPYAIPAADFNLLIGDWYKSNHKVRIIFKVIHILESSYSNIMFSLFGLLRQYLLDVLILLYIIVVISLESC